MRLFQFLFALMMLAKVSHAATSSVVTIDETAVDKTVLRFDGTSGKLVQGSGVTISDANLVTAPGGFSGNVTGNVTGSVTGGSTLNVLKAGDTMTGTLAVTGLTNTSLTASRALVSGADKSVTSSATTATEIGYVSGVTSAIQAQIDSLTGGGTGDVVGPASAVSGKVATFNGVTGKLIQDSGITLGTLATQNGTFSGTSSGSNSGDQDLSALQPLDADLTAIAALTTTAAGLSLLDDADASAQRTTLGLGTLATQSGTFSGTSSGNNTGDQSSIVGITGSLAEFNTALTGADFASGGGTATGTNTGDQTSVTGNSGTATSLATGRTLSITGDLDWTSPSFDGTGNVAAAGTITAGAVTLAKQANMATASVVYRKTAGAGVPEVQTLATLKTDLGLTGTNSGDQSSIVGITGTKAQLDTAVTDGNILYVGDVTQYTDELAQDAVGAMVDASLTYVDGTPLLQRAALTGAITATAGSNATVLGSFTTAALNTAISDNDIATGGGTATGTNTGDQTTISGNAGSATVLQNSRNFSIAGSGITAAAVGFTGAANVALAASVDAGHITLARMADVATATVFYRKTAATGAPEVQTLATLKTDLGLTGSNSGDQTSIVGISGTLAQFDAAVSDADLLSVAAASAAYQPLDTQLTSLAGLAYAGNTLKFARVNAGETGFELVTLAGGGDALVGSPLSQFAATTSAQFAGVISNETGTGVVVLATDPALAGNPTAPTAAVNDNDTSIATTAFVQTGGPVKVLALASNATVNSTTTGVEITGLNLTVPAGTYTFQYFVRYQVGATTTGVQFAVNHTGTAAVFMANMRLMESTTAASTGAATQAGYLVTALRLMSGSSARAKATTVPNLGASISADAANADMLAVIEGLIIVTASGDLELWHASEVAAASTVMAGTSLILTKTGS